jgi:hypothetical protein
VGTSLQELRVAGIEDTSNGIRDALLMRGVNVVDCQVESDSSGLDETDSDSSFYDVYPFEIGPVDI